MGKISVVIDNGYGYSDYGVYGSVIIDEEQKPLLEQIIKDCALEFTKEKKAYWENIKLFKPAKYPIDIEDNLIKKLKENNITFFTEIWSPQYD